MRECLFGWRGVTLSDCVFYKVGSLPDVQLFHNIRAVMFHGTDAYAKEVSNLFVCKPFGDEL